MGLKEEVVREFNSMRIIGVSTKAACRYIYQTYGVHAGKTKRWAHRASKGKL